MRSKICAAIIRCGISFFEEIECEDPEAWLRSRLKGKEIELTVEPGTAGAVTIHAVVDGLMQKFVFTPI